jgi:hypothetical protein
VSSFPPLALDCPASMLTCTRSLRELQVAFEDTHVIAASMVKKSDFAKDLRTTRNIMQAHLSSRSSSSVESLAIKFGGANYSHKAAQLFKQYLSKHPGDKFLDQQRYQGAALWLQALRSGEEADLRKGLLMQLGIKEAEINQDAYMIAKDCGLLGEPRLQQRLKACVERDTGSLSGGVSSASAPVILGANGKRPRAGSNQQQDSAPAAGAPLQQAPQPRKKLIVLTVAQPTKHEYLQRRRSELLASLPQEYMSWREEVLGRDDPQPEES